MNRGAPSVAGSAHNGESRPLDFTGRAHNGESRSLSVTERVHNGESRSLSVTERAHNGEEPWFPGDRSLPTAVPGAGWRSWPRLVHKSHGVLDRDETQRVFWVGVHVRAQSYQPSGTTACLRGDVSRPALDLCWAPSPVELRIRTIVGQPAY